MSQVSWFLVHRTGIFKMKKMVKSTLGKHKLFLSRNIFQQQNLFSKTIYFNAVTWRGSSSPCNSEQSHWSLLHFSYEKKWKIQFKNNLSLARWLWNPSAALSSQNHGIAGCLGWKGPWRTSSSNALPWGQIWNYLNQCFIFKNSWRKGLSL